MYKIEWKIGSTGYKEPYCDGDIIHDSWAWIRFAERCNEIEKELKKICRDRVKVIIKNRELKDENQHLLESVCMPDKCINLKKFEKHNIVLQAENAKLKLDIVTLQAQLEARR